MEPFGTQSNYIAGGADAVPNNLRNKYSIDLRRERSSSVWFSLPLPSVVSVCWTRHPKGTNNTCKFYSPCQRVQCAAEQVRLLTMQEKHFVYEISLRPKGSQSCDVIVFLYWITTKLQSSEEGKVLSLSLSKNLFFLQGDNLACKCNCVFCICHESGKCALKMNKANTPIFQNPLSELLFPNVVSGELQTNQVRNSSIMNWNWKGRDH